MCLAGAGRSMPMCTPRCFNIRLRLARDVPAKRTCARNRRAIGSAERGPMTGSIRSRCVGPPVAARTRQANDELAALTDAVASRFDRSAMQLDNVAGECQADAKTAMDAFERFVRLREHVEHRPQHLRRDADAVVLDGDADTVVVC